MRTTLAGLAMLSVLAAACGHELDTATNLDTPAAASDEEMVVLAAFALSNGNTIKMYGLPELNEIIVAENTPAGEGEQFLTDEYPTDGPLELFVRLTSADVPVPRLIVDLASPDVQAAALGQRDIVADQALGEFFVDTAELGWIPVAHKGSGSCAAGNAGKTYFEDNHCGQSGPYGYGASEIDCDSGRQTAWQRTSAATMRHTYTRTAACDGSGRIRHMRKKVSGWSTVLDEPIPPNSIAKWVSYKKGAVKYKRRARSERLDPFDADARVRMWTKYYSQVVLNAP